MTSSRPSTRSLLALVLLVAIVSGGSQWWHAHQDARIGRDIAAVARAGDIRLLSSQTCGWCTIARGWLREQGVPFEECFIEQDAACRAAFDAAQAQGTPTVVVKGRVQAGFDPGRVLQALRA